MNQRRAQIRLDLLTRREQQEQLQKALADPNYSQDMEGGSLYHRQTRSAKTTTKYQACQICSEKIPTFETKCEHRLCGECIPEMIRHKNESVLCPVCKGEEPIPIIELGRYLDSLVEG